MLVPPERVDHSEEHFPETCNGCGRSLRGVQPEPEPWRHQVAELPEIRAQITEHRCHRVCCPRCNTITVAPLPAGVASGDFGPRLRAFVALLVGRFRLSRREVVELCREAFDLTISVGGVVRVLSRVSEALAGPVRALTRKVRRVRVVFLDDTTWWLKRARRALWVVCTKWDSLYQVASGRTKKAVRALLGAKFRGIGIGDRAKANGEIPAERRQVCWCHLQRNFKGLADRGGRCAWLGEWGVDVAARLFHHWGAYKRGEITRRAMQRRMGHLEAEVEELLEWGCQHGDGKARRFCEELWKVRPSLFLFARVDGVEPTSNRPERDLRPAVLWRKGCFGSQSDGGLLFVGRILSATRSCRRRAIPLLAYLTEVCRAQDERRPVPLWWRWRARDGT